jgi:hypothetical protein
MISVRIAIAPTSKDEGLLLDSSKPRIVLTPRLTRFVSALCLDVRRLCAPFVRVPILS